MRSVAGTSYKLLTVNLSLNFPTWLHAFGESTICVSGSPMIAFQCSQCSVLQNLHDQNIAMLFRKGPILLALQYK